MINSNARNSQQTFQQTKVHLLNKYVTLIFELVGRAEEYVDEMLRQF